MSHADKLEKRGSKFVVLSMEGKELGEFDTEAEARERLRQIEAAKAAKGDSPVISPERQAWIEDVIGRKISATLDSVESVRRVDYLGEIHFDRARKDGALASLTPEGFLRVDARLTRTGVFIYADAEGNSWGELRTEDEVFHPDATRSFEMVVLTDEHPADFVDASNVREVQVGHVGTDVRRDGDFLAASIVVTDQNAIRSITDGKMELSCGYTAQVVKEDGVSKDGTPFAARQTQIRGNHVALVSKGRAGPDCRLLVGRGDAFSTEAQPMKTETPAMETLTLDGKEYPVPPEVSAAFTKLTTAKAVEDEDTMTKTNDDATALRARLDAVEADATTRAQSEAARIDARVNLVTAAREILGRDHKTDGVADADLMRDVILTVNPTLKDRLEANKDSVGYLRASYEAAVDLHNARKDVETEISATLFDVMGGDPDSKMDVDADYRGYLNRITGRETAKGA